MDRPGVGPLRVRAGQPLELVVDTSRVHFFDPITGETIGHPLAAADPAAAAIA